MRPEHEQTSYFVIDPKDQPDSLYILFLTINGTTNLFAVDDLIYDDGPGIVGFIRRGEVREVVMRFKSDNHYVLVRRDWLEALSRDDMRRHTIAAVPKQAERGDEYTKAIQAAQRRYSEEGSDQRPGTDRSDFTDYMRRMFGDEGEKL